MGGGRGGGWARGTGVGGGPRGGVGEGDRRGGTNEGDRGGGTKNKEELSMLVWGVTNNPLTPKEKKGVQFLFYVLKNRALCSPFVHFIHGGCFSPHTRV